MPYEEQCKIIDRKEQCANTFSITMEAGKIAAQAKPGQFIEIKCGEHLLLRRPISICDVTANQLKMVFEVKGAGTKWLSERKMGDVLDLLGPLGNGFDLPGKNVIVVGGGIGVPPLLYAAKSSPGTVTAILGFRDSDRLMLKDEFEALCQEVDITTDDGSFGIHGFVTDPLAKRLEQGGYDAVFACGPKMMLRAIAEVCSFFEIPCQVSMEERMGCGVGACLVCACKTRENGVEHMSRVCKDGPVFDAVKVVW